MNKCTHCGVCCQNFSIPKVSVYNTQQALARYPFLTHKNGHIRKVGKVWVPIFNCTRLKWKDGKSYCSDYENRPDFCKKFPEDDQPRPEKCTM